jgi:NhaA family Na+:H+ antiporter
MSAAVSGEVARLTGVSLTWPAWADIAGIGVLGGIGFTVSLLIAELSDTSETHLTDAKGAILLASTAASLLAVILGCRSRHHRLAERQGHGHGHGHGQKTTRD